MDKLKKGKYMKKENLKYGNVVETENGKRYLFTLVSNNKKRF